MRILHVFPNFNIGGPQRRFAQIVNAPGEQFTHSIVSINRNFDALELLGHSVHIESIDKAWREGNLITRASRCRQTLREIRPDLLVTYNWGAIEWAFVNLDIGIPHIHLEDGFGPEEADKQLRRRIWGRRVALARSFAIVVPSRSLKTVAEELWRFSPRRIHLIPNGTPIARGLQDAPFHRSDIGLPERGLVVGWAGGLRKEKNVGRLVRAFAKLSAESTLLIIGDGPELAAISSQIEQLGIQGRIRMLGNRTDVERILPLIDVLALSSDTEQMPMIILEAMSARLPIVSTDVGDIAEMVAPENRPFLVERSDAALARALEEIAGSRELRRSIGAANRMRAERQHSPEHMIHSYFELFEQATSATGQPGRRLVRTI